MSNIDKAARLATEAEAAAKEEAAKRKAFNPPFPFRIIPFDARFFGLR